MTGYDHIWVPRFLHGDHKLISSMCRMSKKFSHEQIIIAFEFLCSNNSGMNKSQSLVDDLYEKSGPFAKPFVEQALVSLQKFVIQGSLGLEIEKIFLSENLDNAEDDESIIETQVYRVCLWELFTSLIVVLVAGDDLSSPASCFDTIARSRYLEERIYSVQQPTN